MGERESKKESHPEEKSILAQGFVETILAGAKAYLQENGELHSALLLLHLNLGELAAIQPALPGTAEERQNYFSALGLSIRLAGQRIQEALFVSEVWYVQPEDGVKSLDVAPSQHQNRREAIAIMGRDAPGKRFTIVLQPFARDAQNQPVFEPMASEEYNVSSEDGHHSVGLIDHLFKFPPSRRSR